MSFDILRTLLFGLIPPELPMNENGGPSKADTARYRKQKRRWYRSVAVALWILLLGGGVFVGWALGMIPGTTRLAHADEIQQQVTDALKPIQADIAQIKRDVSEGKQERLGIQEILLGDKVLEARQNQCKALSTSDSGVVFWTQKLREAKEAFAVKIGHPYDVPSCRELGIAVNAND